MLAIKTDKKPKKNQVALDALPYYDTLINDPQVKAQAEALIEAECAVYKPRKSYVAEVLPPLQKEAFITPILKSEYERLDRKERLNALDMDRYVLPAPPAGHQQDLTAWEQCIENSAAQLEHQSVRLENLTLLEEFGCAAYRVNNDYLQASVAYQKKFLEKLRKNLHEIHWNRKSMHDNFGLKLDEAEQGWNQKIADNFQLEEELNKMRAALESFEQARKMNVQDVPMPIGQE